MSLIIERRAFIAGAGAVVLAPTAIAAAECRSQGPLRSISSCAAACDDPFAAFQCQLGVLFPGERSILRGAVAGAVLGGVIAFASGDVSILAGIAIGGVVGGLFGATQKYMGYRMAYAQGNYFKAQDELEADKFGDEDRLKRVKILDVLGPIAKTVTEMARDLRVADVAESEVQPLASPPSGMRDEFRPVFRMMSRISEGHKGTSDTVGVSQNSLQIASRSTQRAVQPPGREIAEHLAFLDSAVPGMLSVGRRVALRLAMAAG